MLKIVVFICAFLLIGSAAFDILVGHGHHISQVHFEEVSTDTVRTNTTGTVVGVDYFES